MIDVTRKLFLAVERGQTGNANIYLDQGAAIDAKEPKLKETPLIRAARLRNYVVQKLLLTRGANPRLKNVEGLTALHYVCLNGDEESVKLLLAHGAPLDVVDQLGCSPLHYAVNRGNVGTLNVLLFCGANAFRKDALGRSPLSSTNEPLLREILKDSKLILFGIRNNDIFLQHKELSATQTYHFDKLGLYLHTHPDIGKESVSFLCKRTRPEYSSRRLKPAHKELLMSDNFEYVMSRARTNVIVTLEIPLYGPPNPYEEIVMKTIENPFTNGQEALSDVRRIGEKDKWICCATMDLTKCSGFVLVTRPKVEYFVIGPSPVYFTSEIDDYITLDIPEETFEQPGAISLEVIPSPSYREEDAKYKNLITIGHFYQICHSSFETPKHDITMSLPIPNDYTGDGDLFLLSTSLPDNWFDVMSDYDEGAETVDKEEKLVWDDDEETSAVENWEVLNEDAEPNSGKVFSSIPHFSIHVPMEVKKGTPETEVKQLADVLCKSSCKREKFIMFFTMVKPLGDDQFSIVVECADLKRVNRRKDFWRSHGYRDQIPEGDSGDVAAIPATEFTISVPNDEDNNMIGGRTLPLQFHPNRKNFQNFEVKVKDPNRKSRRGRINIKQKLRKDQDEESGYETQLTVSLTGSKLVEDEDGDDHKGFTNDKFLRKLAKELGDEWMTVGLLLGLTHKTLEAVRKEKKMTMEQKKFQMLQLWRDLSRYRYDTLGIPDLLFALRRTSRQDIIDFIHKELKHWLDNYVNKEDQFYKWLKFTINGPDLERTEGTVEPLSDQFFVLLVEKAGDDLRNIGLDLDLPLPELENIFEDTLHTNSTHKLITMLVTARDKHRDKAEFFHLLRDSLESLNNPTVIKWVNEVSKGWVEKTEQEEKDRQSTTIRKDDNFFLTQLSDVFQELNEDSTA